jgi:hypothetical protein
MSLNHPRCSSDRSIPFDIDKGLLIEQISIKVLIANCVDLPLVLLQP